MKNAALDIARHYLSLGWKPVPVLRGEKNPVIKGWGKMKVTPDNVAQHFNGVDQNIGIQFGEVSGGLADVDLDCPEAVKLAAHLLPNTDAIFGRASKPASHYLYVTHATDKKASKQFRDADRKVIVELRMGGGGKAAQTIFPGSIHPSGEALSWVKHGKPAEVPFAQLMATVTRLAVGALLVRHWPSGDGHEAALRVAGFLTRSGWEAGDVADFVGAIAHAAGDEHHRDHERTARDAAESHARGEKVYGFPALQDFFGEGQAKLVAQWLGYRHDTEQMVLVDGAPTFPRKAPYKAAQTFISLKYMHDGRRTLHRYRGTFWRWTGTSYQEQDEQEVIRAEAYRFLDGALTVEKGVDVPFQPTKHDVDQLIDALKAVCILPDDDAPMWIDEAQSKDPRDFLPVANGLLHLPSGELHQHAPSYFNLAASAVAYDPKAPVPANWNKFLDQVWPGDKQSKNTLHEIFGYLLIADTFQQKIFLWIGEPRSGKGTTLRVLTQLVGVGSVVPTSMGDLKCQFGLQPLIGKSVATLADARLGRGDPATLTERLLSISGGDSQPIQRKYKGNWDGHLAVRFIMLSNELPAFADPTGTIGTRFIVLEFANSFLGKEDPHLINKLLPELPGILNLAIAGYRRLKRRGHFIQPASAQAAADELRRTDVKAFIEDKCKLGPNETATTDKVYAAYRDYCETNGLQPKDSRQFGMLLKSAAKPTVITKHRPREGKNRTHFYHGIDVEMDKFSYTTPVRNERD